MARSRKPRSSPRTCGRPFRDFGITEPLSLNIAPIAEPNILQERTGLLPGDRIVAVNGQKVDHHWEFNQIVEKTLTPTVEITAERQGEGQTQTIQTKLPLDWTVAENGEVESEADLSHVYSLVPRLRVLGVNGEDGFASPETARRTGPSVCRPAISFSPPATSSTPRTRNCARSPRSTRASSCRSRC